VQRAVLEDRAVVRVHARALRELGEIDEHVDRDERLRDHAACAFEAGPADAGRHPRDALRLPRMLRAPLADRGGSHAIAADRPAALGARKKRLAVRVPVTPHRFGHGTGSVATCGFMSRSRPRRLRGGTWAWSST